MKRIIPLIISIAMVASLCTGLAITGFAAVEDTFEEGGIKYKVLTEEGTTGTVEVVKKEGFIPKANGYTEPNYKIPATVTYDSITYNVTSIGANAFNGCGNLTSVTIGDNVTTIGDDAFLNCSKLTSLTFCI